MKKTTLLLLFTLCFIGLKAQTTYWPKYGIMSYGYADSSTVHNFYGSFYLKNVQAGLLRLNASRQIVTTTLTESDIPSLSQSKVIGLGDSLAAKQNAADKGQINGFASLDGSGKVPLTQINDALIGSVNYKGSYNVATNTPALPTAGTDNKGWYYIVNDTIPTVFAGDSIYSGDWVISNGAAWEGLRQNRPEVDPVYLSQKATLVQLTPSSAQSGTINVTSSDSRVIKGQATTTGYAVSGYAATGIGVNGEASGTGGTAGKFTAADGQGINVLNNSSTAPTIYAYQTGSGNIAEFNTSGGLKASISNAGDITGNSFIKSGGTSSQTLMADGSTATLGSNAYTSTAYLPVASPTFTGTLTGPNLTMSGSGTFGNNVTLNANGTSFQWDASGNKVAMNATSGTWTLYTGTAYTQAIQVNGSQNTTFAGSGTFGGGIQGTWHNIYEAGASRGGLYSYNNVIGGGSTDYSLGLFSEDEIFFSPSGFANKRLTLSSTLATLSVPLTGTSATFSGNLTLRNNTAVDRFRFFVGDGTSGTVDENYLRNLNTDLHIMGGGFGTSEIARFGVDGITSFFGDLSHKGGTAARFYRPDNGDFSYINNTATGGQVNINFVTSINAMTIAHSGAITAASTVTATGFNISATPSTPANPYHLLTRRDDNGDVEQVELSQTVAGDDFNPVTSDAVNAALATKADALTTVSGIYTPTFTAGTNVLTVGGNAFRYMRVGSRVHVMGYVSGITTTTTGASTVRVSLPIASGFTGGLQCVGFGVCNTDNLKNAVMQADQTNDEAQLDFTAVSTNGTIYISFMYDVI